MTASGGAYVPNALGLSHLPDNALGLSRLPDNAPGQFMWLQDGAGFEYDLPATARNKKNAFIFVLY